MESFVNRIAKEVLDLKADLSDICVIVPSERMITYLHAALFDVDEKIKLAPKIVTIDRWLQALIDEPVLDRTRLLLKLYAIYKKDPIEYELPSFDAFLTWGQLLLSDFEEIDRYLIDAKQLFKNLRDIKEIENWSFNAEQLSPAQLKFLAFWDKLGPYYHELEKQLIEDKAITKGKIYRKVAENIDVVFQENKQAYFVFAGFNALSIAELSIMKQLYVMGRASIFMDADSFYLDDKLHEAGTFLRVLKNELQVNELPFVINQLRNKPLNIELVECPQVTAQSKVISTHLAQLSTQELNETLVLLADEKLITTLLPQLPGNIHQANITLGLPLRTTSLRLWVDLVFRIQENSIQRGNRGLYHKDVHQITHHPFILGILTAEERIILARVEDEMLRKNKFYLEREKLYIATHLKTIIDLLLEPWDSNWVKAVQCFQSLNQVFDAHFKAENEFEQALVRTFFDTLIPLQNCLQEPFPPIQLLTFKQLFNQHWTTESIAYYGNPMEGLQIMGLLETRGLDFKRILILGLNEGSMPPTNPIQTLIPMDLRKYFNLPTPREKQGLFAHHFYRLLHNAEEVLITYATAQDQTGSTEPSRFIQQLQLELCEVNPAISWNKSYYTIGGGEKLKETVIEKDEKLIQRLDELLLEGLTVSKMNAFLACPLNFYYRYVLKIGEENKVEESIESSTLGTIIHQVMEDLLAPFLPIEGKQLPLTPEAIKEMQKKAPLLVEKAFQQHFSEDKRDYQNGSNYVTYVVANKMVERLLRRELEECERNPNRYLRIQGLELELEKHIDIKVGDSIKKVRLNGIIDRVDQRDSFVRVIDYKSGVLSHDKVELKEGRDKNEFKDALLKAVQKGYGSYHLQLLMYAVLYKSKFNVAPDEMGIISFVNTSDSPFLFSYNGETNPHKFIDQVEEVIQLILEQMYDTSVPFKHNSASQFCTYCT